MGAARQNLGSSSHLQKVFSARISLLAELHGVLFSHHASPLEVYVFVAVDERGEHVMSDEIYLSSMQRKTARKEAWRPKCAAPRLVCL